MKIDWKALLAFKVSTRIVQTSVIAPTRAKYFDPNVFYFAALVS